MEKKLSDGTKTVTTTTGSTVSGIVENTFTV